jgi:hypothetical protein
VNTAGSRATLETSAALTSEGGGSPMGKKGSREPEEKQRARWLEAVAHHEAGHAIASFRRKRAIRHVTIVPAADSAGHVAHYKAPACFQAIDVTVLDHMGRKSTGTVRVLQGEHGAALDARRCFLLDPALDIAGEPLSANKARSRGNK